MSENNYVVKKVAVSETLRSLPLDEPIKFNCGELTDYASVVAVISYLNKKAGRTEFTISTDDNGASYTITRK